MDDAFLHGLDGWMIVCTVKKDGKFRKDHVRSHVLLKIYFLMKTEVGRN
jgi:hypothetical protein